MKSRYKPPAKDTPPPSTAEDGAKRIGAAMVSIFDRKDGTGADWQLVAESMARAAFAMLDRLPQPDRLKLATRIHEGAYSRMTNSAVAPSPADPQPSPAPAAAPAFNQPTPKAPR